MSQKDVKESLLEQLRLQEKGSDPGYQKAWNPL